MKIFKIYIALLFASFLIAGISCGDPISLAYIDYRIIVTNNSTNEISVIAKEIKAGYSVFTDWNEVSPDYRKWYELYETNGVFYHDSQTPSKLYSSYWPGARDYNITEDGTIIGIIIESNTNYFISIEEHIARELFPELTNDTLIYGFAYLYYNYGILFYTPFAFSSDLITNVIDYEAIHSDYVIIVENDSMKLSLSFSGWVDPNDIDYGDPNKSTNLTAVTNFSY